MKIICHASPQNIGKVLYVDKTVTDNSVESPSTYIVASQVLSVVLKAIIKDTDYNILACKSLLPCWHNIQIITNMATVLTTIFLQSTII